MCAGTYHNRILVEAQNCTVQMIGAGHCKVNRQPKNPKKSLSSALSITSNDAN